MQTDAMIKIATRGIINKTLYFLNEFYKGVQTNYDS